MGFDIMITTTDIWSDFQWPEWFVEKWRQYLHFEIIINNKYYGTISSKLPQKKTCIPVILEDIIKVIKECSNTVFLERYGIRLYEIWQSYPQSIKMVIIRKFDHKYYSFIPTADDEYENNEGWIPNE